MEDFPTTSAFVHCFLGTSTPHEQTAEAFRCRAGDNESCKKTAWRSEFCLNKIINDKLRKLRKDENLGKE